MSKQQRLFIFLFIALGLFNASLWFFYPQQTTTEYVVELVDLPLIPVLPANHIQDTLELSATAAYALDLSSLTVLYTKNHQEPRYPASSVKMMTALLALDEFDLSQELAVVSEATTPGTRAPLQVGQRVRVDELLATLLIASANDSAFVLANNYPGGGSAFVTAMNQRASLLGLKQTVFVNPAGLDDSLQLTTARDLALLARELLRFDYLRQLVATPYLQLRDPSRNMALDVSNTNQLLGQIMGVKGIKTGTTDLAGEVLVSLIEREGRSILLVLLGSQDRYADTTRLLSWIFNNYKWQEMVPTAYNTTTIETTQRLYGEF